MKKILAITLTLLLIVAAFAGCNGLKNGTESSAPTPVAKADINIAGLKGPTTMGLVKVYDDNEKGAAANNYTFTIAGSADEITPKLTKGELDIAAIPANLASVLYNKTEGKIKVLGINTLGVVYIVEKGEAIKNLADLKGKTIYATGKGSTPEYALRYILKENGIDPDKDVKLEWKSEPTEVVALLKNAEDGVAMLPQPYVTVAQGSVEGLRIAINLNDEWNSLGNDSMFITGVVVARTEFLDNNKAAVNEFLKEYKASTAYVNENVETAATLIEKVGIVKAPVAQKAIPFCNITYIDGAKMKTALKGYLQTLFDNNPASVGGKLPDDNFYYEK